MPDAVPTQKVAGLYESSSITVMTNSQMVGALSTRAPMKPIAGAYPARDA